MDIRHITIIGNGALGVMYAKYIMDHCPEGMQVDFLADSRRVERYRKEVITCNGESCDFHYRNADEKQEPADLLIFAVKGTGLRAAIETAKAVIGPETIVMSVLNGITSEEEIGEVLGSDRVIHCMVVGMDAVKLGNEMTYQHMGMIHIGVDRPEKKELLERVKACFDRITLQYKEEEDILTRIWAKWMLNVGLNPTIMIYEGTYATVQKPGEARRMMQGAMREVMELANRSGIALTQKDLDDYVALIDTLNPEGMPSMRQDGMLKRPTEVEMFTGSVVRKAKELGVEVPINEEIYRRVKEMEAAYLQ